jgi:hypothetical protein
MEEVYSEQRVVVQDSSCPVCGEVASVEQVERIVKEVERRMEGCDSGLIQGITGIICPRCVKFSRFYEEHASIYLRLKGHAFLIGVQEN